MSHSAVVCTFLIPWVRVPNDTQVMVRWTHSDSGEVLLFTPRKVSEQQQQNWVSFYPMTGSKWSL